MGKRMDAVAVPDGYPEHLAKRARDAFQEIVTMCGAAIRRDPSRIATFKGFADLAFKGERDRLGAWKRINAPGIAGDLELAEREISYKESLAAAFFADMAEEMGVANA